MHIKFFLLLALLHTTAYPSYNGIDANDLNKDIIGLKGTISQRLNATNTFVPIMEGDLNEILIHSQNLSNALLTRNANCKNKEEKNKVEDLIKDVIAFFEVAQDTLRRKQGNKTSIEKTFNNIQKLKENLKNPSKTPNPVATTTQVASAPANTTPPTNNQELNKLKENVAKTQADFKNSKKPEKAKAAAEACKKLSNFICTSLINAKNDLTKAEMTAKDSITLISIGIDEKDSSDATKLTITAKNNITNALTKK